MEGEFKPRRPDYKGDGIAIWKGTDKEGKLILKVKVLNMSAVICYKTEEPQGTIEEGI